jgi:hypothetical protein
MFLSVKINIKTYLEEKTNSKRAPFLIECNPIEDILYPKLLNCSTRTLFMALVKQTSCPLPGNKNSTLLTTQLKQLVKFIQNDSGSDGLPQICLRK